MVKNYHSGRKEAQCGAPRAENGSPRPPGHHGPLLVHQYSVRPKKPDHKHQFSVPSKTTPRPHLTAYTSYKGASTFSCAWPRSPSTRATSSTTGPTEPMAPLCRSRLQQHKVLYVHMRIHAPSTNRAAGVRAVPESKAEAQRSPASTPPTPPGSLNGTLFSSAPLVAAATSTHGLADGGGYIQYR